MHGSSDSQTPWDLIVVGGGLAGLTAAALAARQGKTVRLVEKSSHLGGRADTTLRDGVNLNLGPHALYKAGDTFRILRELGVEFTGNVPDQGEPSLLWQGEFHTWPRSLTAVLRTSLFTLPEKWKLVRFFRQAARLDAADYDNVSVSQWVRQTAGTGNFARLVRTLLRLSTFVEDPEYQSAGAALRQLQVGLKGNVWYVDHGWRSLVEGLREVADQNCMLTLSSRAAAVSQIDNLVEVRLTTGETLSARAVILATPPEEVVKLLDLPEVHPLALQVHQARPARAACLDVALQALPRPQQRFALGLDEPIYFSVHSGPARLAPQGIEVVHVMRYLGPERPEDPKLVEQQLEGILDQLQPGWRSLVFRRRFLPNMVVASDVPAASRGGLSGRPNVNGVAFTRIFLAGDWVGSAGQLADASTASAESAVKHALAAMPARQVSEQYA